MRQTGRGKRKTGRKKYTYEKPHTAAEYRRRRRQQQVRIQRMLLLLGIALVVIFIFVLGGKLLRWIRGKHLAAADVPAAITKVVENPPDYDVQLLTINDYSRPGLAIDQVNGIVVHYTANPGTTAQQNRDYFEGLKDSHETHASSHFVIGLCSVFHVTRLLMHPMTGTMILFPSNAVSRTIPEDSTMPPTRH